MIERIHNAIALLLTTDPLFVADIQALQLGSQDQAVAPGLITGFRDPRQVPQNSFPAWLFEKGDSETTALADGGSEFSVIGFTQQGMAADVLCGLIWNQQNHAKAYAQRLQLERILVDLFLRYPDPGGATLAWVRAIDFDRGALHPMQTAQITIRVEYPAQRIAR